MSRSTDVVRLSGDEYDRLMDEREMMRQECDRAWKEVEAIQLDRDKQHGWRQDLADQLAECERHRDAIASALRRREDDLMTAHNALGQIVTMADRAIGCSPSEMDDYIVQIAETARKAAP